MFLYDILKASGTTENLSVIVKKTLVFYADLLSPFRRKKVMQVYPTILKKNSEIENLTFPEFKLLLTDLSGLLQAEIEDANLKHHDILDVIAQVSSIEIEAVDEKNEEKIYAITNKFAETIKQFSI